jgi:hypothetical protein
METRIKYFPGKTKKVLMVCTGFPPQSDVGALRPAMFSKFLPFYGFFPIIFTRSLPMDDPLCNLTMEIKGLPSRQNQISFFYGKKKKFIFCKIEM